MASEVEQFAQRLSEELVARIRHSDRRREYVMTGDLQQAIAQALRPAGVITDEYPRWLFRAGDTRSVNDQSEEVSAGNEGWSRQPPPQYEEGFPTWRVERPQMLGGKVFDHRRVMLHTSAELRQFNAVVEEGDWVEDSVANIYGARGVPLSALIAERKELLKAIVDQEQLEVASEPVEPSEDEPAMPENDEVEATPEVSAEEASEVTID